MDKSDLEKLKEIGNRMKQLNNKFRLLNLLRTAKEEYDKNQYDDCIQICEEILKDNPKNPVALRGLGCSMQAIGNFAKAEMYYNQAILYSENKEIELTLLGMLYYLQDDLDIALEYFNSAIDENDNYELAYEGKNQTMLERHLKIADLQDALIKQQIF